MRFEIKSGGIAAILVGIAALSGAVFMLGLLAGYDVGRESQSSAEQVATAYPVAAPPAQPAGASDIGAAPAAAPSAAAPVAPPPPAAPVATAKRPRAVASATASRGASPPEAVAGDAADDSEGDADRGDAVRAAPPERPAAPASAPPAAHPRHKPFNIQIEAAMDRNGADEMVHRLQALGYQPHLVPAQLNGQTWYKVVIGPYPTQEAAAAAQQDMRTKYNNIYGGGTSGGGASNPSD